MASLRKVDELLRATLALSASWSGLKESVAALPKADRELLRTTLETMDASVARTMRAVGLEP